MAVPPQVLMLCKVLSVYNNFELAVFIHFIGPRCKNV